MIPESIAASAAKRLVDDVNHFGHLTTGFLGTPLLCQALTDNGYPEIAYKLLFNKRYPSWLYPVTKGATTIWERWDGIKPDGSFQDVGMNSFNHYAFGAVGAWMYNYSLGILRDDNSPGFKHFILQPEPDATEQMTFAKGYYDSMYGRIESSWEIKNATCYYRFVVPPNTSATVYLSAQNKKDVIINSKKRSIEFLRMENSKAVFKLVSGVYSFETSLIKFKN